MVICNNCGAQLGSQLTACPVCGAPNLAAGGTPAQTPHPPFSQTGAQPQRVVPLAPPTPQPTPPAPPVPAPSTTTTLLIIGLALGLLVVSGVLVSVLIIYNSGDNSSAPKNNTNSGIVSNTNTNYNTNTYPTPANQNVYVNLNTNANANTNLNANIGNANSSPTPIAGFEYAERKILNNQYLSTNDLSSLTRYQLQLLRNTVFAKYGRIFLREPDLQRHFDKRPWYVPNEAYNSGTIPIQLTNADEANIVMIRTAESFP